MLFLIILAVLTLYLGNGVRSARNRYALQKYEYNQVDSGPKAQEAKARLLKMNHASWCYLEYSVLRSQGCTCGQRPDWVAARATINVDSKLKPDSPYATIFFWPFTAGDTWLRGKDLKKPDYALIAARDAELGFEPMEHKR